MPKLLARLLAGEEICATDPDLVKMTQTAINSRVYIKALLNLTVSKDSSPLWLMGTLLDRLGLKTVSCKRGRRGEQVTYRHLSQDETDFAMEFLEYREQVRQQKSEKERGLREERERYQAAKERQYGISRASSLVSTPPHNGVFHNLGEGVDTSDNQESGSSIPPLETWSIFKPYYKLLESAIDLGVDVINQIIESVKEEVYLSCRVLSLLTAPSDWILKS